MDRFDELYKKLMEMTSSILGNPVDAPPIGSTVNSLYNSDSYAPKTTVRAKSLFPLQSRSGKVENKRRKDK